MKARKATVLAWVLPKQNLRQRQQQVYWKIILGISNERIKKGGVANGRAYYLR